MRPRNSSGGGRNTAAVGLIGLIAVVAVFVLVTLLAVRDTGDISVGDGPPGREYPDLGADHLQPGERPTDAYNSEPPTSGAHVPAPILRDQTVISNDQLLHALERGNVVIFYGTPSPPPGLRRLVPDPFSPQLAEGGQAVILARRPRLRGLAGVAWRHLLPTGSPSDPRLRDFVRHWLGRGTQG